MSQHIYFCAHMLLVLKTKECDHESFFVCVCVIMNLTGYKYVFVQCMFCLVSHALECNFSKGKLCNVYVP